ncbi:Toll/interleukin-1 receptor domain-containing protein, partial [Tanacetum coccineum]
YPTLDIHGVVTAGPLVFMDLKLNYEYSTLGSKVLYIWLCGYKQRAAASETVVANNGSNDFMNQVHVTETLEKECSMLHRNDRQLHSTFQALKDKGIYTYKDDEKIQKGERISDDLFQSIENSKFYIIVFFQKLCILGMVFGRACQDYGVSKDNWAPVFYDVEPIEVRKQSGAVKKAFFNNKKKEVAEKWKGALKEAADLA